MKSHASSSESVTSTNPVSGINLKGLLILLPAIFAAIYWHIAPLNIRTDLDFPKITGLFGYLFLLSLFVERSIEFYLSLVRSSGADELDRNIEKLRQELPSLSDTDTRAIENRQVVVRKLQDAEDERIRYRARSRQIALWTGIVIGVFISLAGVRILGTVFETPVDKVHERILIVVDVLFTGSVLAGGSDPIHKIFKVYNSFMNRVTEANKQKTP